MKINVKGIVVLILSIGLLGCGSMSKIPLKVENVSKLKLGLTTKSEVVKRYGKPQKETMKNNSIGYCYGYASWGKVDVMYLEFDENNVLSSKYLNDSVTKAECPFGKSKYSSSGGGGGGSSSQSCTMDIQCGVGKKCSSGVCTGGIVPAIKGNCVSGDFGKKVCSNSGKSCNVDSQCLN